MEIQRVGAACRKTLDAIEARIRAVRKEIDDTTNAPRPFSEAFEDLKRAMAQQLDYRGSKVLLLRGCVRPERDARSDLMAVLREPLSLLDLYGIFGDELTTRLREKLEVVAVAESKKPGLPIDERPKKIAELEQQARQAEIEAERERLRLELAGYTVLRPDTTDVAALLECWASVDAEAATAPQAQKARAGGSSK